MRRSGPSTSTWTRTTPLIGSFETFEPDVVLHDPAWLGPLSETYGEAILAVPSVATVYLPRDIAGFLDLVSPPEIMDQIDRALVAYLGLEDCIGGSR